MTESGGLVEPTLDGYSELLCSYALFQTAFWQSDGALQGVHRALLPFLATVLKRLNSEAVTVAEVQTGFDDLFGLTLPPHVVNGMLRKAYGAGLLERNTSEGITYLKVKLSTLHDYPDTTKESERIRKEYNNFIAAFRKYCREAFGRTLDRQTSEVGLHIWLLRRIGTISDLSSYATAAIALDDVDPIGDRDGSIDYMLARFILEKLPDEPELAEYFDRIVKGSALATSIYYRGSDVQRLGRAMKEVRVFFDTPILLSLLGLHKREHKQAADDLLRLVKESGAKPSVFRHTQDELKIVLRASVEDMKGARHGLQLDSTMPVVERVVDLRLAGRTPDLGHYLALAERLGIVLRDDFGFDVVDRPSTPRPDEEIPRLEGEISKRYGTRVAARTVEYDVESLFGVYRFRSGQPKADLDECRALFVTTNDSLVAAARSYFAISETGSEVPLAFLDHELATLLWLRSPMKLPSVPWRQVIADCYAALYPGEELWRKYLDLLSQLRDQESPLSEDDYFILRFTVGARLALMDDTQGDANVLTIGSIADILDRARAQLIESAEERVREATESAERATAENFQISSELAQLRQELEHKETEAAARTGTEALARLETARAMIADRCSRKARRTRVTLALGAGLAVVGGTVAAIYSANSDRPIPLVLAVSLAAVALLAGVLGYFDLVHDLNLPALEARQKESCTERQFEKLCSYLVSLES